MTGEADRDLVDRAKQGDRIAFGVMLRPIIDHAYRLAFGMLHDREAAEDVVQEASVRAWRKLANLKPGTQLRPWYLAIVANQARKAAGRKWWSVLRLDPKVELSGGDFEDRVARGADVRAALRKLGVAQREALVLRFYLDLTLDEVAAVVGVPVGTVKSRINRGLAALRPYFEPREALT